LTIWGEFAGLDFAVETFDVGGIATRSLRAGTGPDVVFLHGASGHLESFARNLAPQVRAGYRVHALDLVGHGYTAGLGHNIEIADYLSHLRAFLDLRGVGAAHLVGHSLGGWIAARAAASWPDRVASLQLIAAGGLRADPVVMARITESVRQAVTADDPELTRARLASAMVVPDPGLDELAAIRHAVFHAPGFAGRLPELLCLQEPEIRHRNLLGLDELAGIACPTLVVAGRDDPITALGDAETMAATIAGARLEVLAPCGHWPHFERSERYNPVSTALLRSAG
jgi:2-hydroxy-6-oxonona-2,4-dienedioate hydrolase